MCPLFRGHFYAQFSVDDGSLSFERLLSVADGELSSQQGLKQQQGDGQRFHKQLRAASKKIQHLTELLRESEASSLRLGDQAKLLKEEIRR